MKYQILLLNLGSPAGGAAECSSLRFCHRKRWNRKISDSQISQ